MSTPKQLLAATLASIGVIVTMYFLVTLPHDPGVTRGNTNRLRIGMPKSEAEAILGGTSESTGSKRDKWLYCMLT